MRARTAAGALASLLWAASCVSILDVSAEDYEDLDETLCSCSDAPDACQVVAQDLLARGGVAEKARDCLADSETCPDLDTCLFGSGVCAAIEERCATDGKSQLQLRCCDDTLVCEAGRCAAPACKLAGQGCPGGEGCCDGLTCNDAGSCCAGLEAPCEKPEDCCGETDLCTAEQCEACHVDKQECTEDGECCGSLRCRGVANTKFCAP